MGSEKEGAEAETGGPQTQVSLRDFLIGKTAVTQAQWRMVMSGNPSHFHEAHHSTFAGNQVSEKDSLPVENVSWEDAVAFCRKLTERVRAAGKLPDGMELTLPTEAQWEYACRAGATGDEVRELGAMAWFSGNSKKRTHPVATKQANAWGLHDMNGNVWEWCLDVWQDRLPGGKVTDPMGPKSGDSRVVRGGSYKSTADWCNYTVRGEEAQGDEARADDIGFRLALSSVR